MNIIKFILHKSITSIKNLRLIFKYKLYFFCLFTKEFQLIINIIYTANTYVKISKLNLLVLL